MSEYIPLVSSIHNNDIVPWDVIYYITEGWDVNNNNNNNMPTVTLIAAWSAARSNFNHPKHMPRSKPDGWPRIDASKTSH